MAKINFEELLLVLDIDLISLFGNKSACSNDIDNGMHTATEVYKNMGGHVG